MCALIGDTLVKVLSLSNGQHLWASQGFSEHATRFCLSCVRFIHEEQGVISKFWILTFEGPSKLSLQFRFFPQTKMHARKLLRIVCT